MKAVAFLIACYLALVVAAVATPLPRSSMIARGATPTPSHSPAATDTIAPTQNCAPIGIVNIKGGTTQRVMVNCHAPIAGCTLYYNPSSKNYFWLKNVDCTPCGSSPSPSASPT